MDFPYADHTTEQQSEFLRLTLALLSKQQIPPSPVNYRLSYDYVSGKSEDLKTVLDDCFNTPEKHNQETLWEIYQRFFIQDNQALEKIRAELRHVVSNIQGEVQRSGEELGGFSSELTHFSDVLDESSTPEEMASAVKRMINGTQSALNSQNLFYSHMTELAVETESLRKELLQIREESLTDALTGIANRRAFDLELQESMTEANEQHSALCLLLLDIDHFKKFNDTYGHLTGDKVLRFVATILKRCVKGQDFAARYGGEEFAVILPNTSQVGAKVIAEQIRKAISAKELEDKTRNENYGKITASIGIAEYRFNEVTGDLIKRSDEALYKAKDAGRNRVVFN